MPLETIEFKPPYAKADDLNELRQSILRRGLDPFQPEVDINPGGTVFGVKPDLERIDAIVTKVDGRKHAWSEVRPQNDGTWVIDDAGRAGTIDSMPAYERNGATVTVGTKIRLLPFFTNTNDLQIIVAYIFDKSFAPTISGISGASAGSGGLNTVRWRAVTMISDGMGGCQCILAEFALTGPDITLSIDIDLPTDACTDSDEEAM